MSASGPCGIATRQPIASRDTMVEPPREGAPAMSTITAPATQAEQAAFDTIVAEQLRELAKRQQAVEIAMIDVHRFVGDKQDWFGKQRRWRMSDEGALKAFDALPTSDAHMRVMLAYVKAIDARAVVQNELIEKDEIYRSAPWSRFVEVTSSNGHIHSHTACSTCNPRTTYGWWPELSGLTEADAVAKLGPILCSVCFPSAPTEWKLSRSDVRAASDA